MAGLTKQQVELQQAYKSCKSHEEWISIVNPNDVNLDSGTPEAQQVQAKADFLGMAWMDTDTVRKQVRWAIANPDAEIDYDTQVDINFRKMLTPRQREKGFGLEAHPHMAFFQKRWERYAAQKPFPKKPAQTQHIYYGGRHYVIFRDGRCLCVSTGEILPPESIAA